MKHSSAFRSRVARSRRPLWYRPILESLERRLPPGDMLWTLILGGSGPTLDMDAKELEKAEAALRFEEEPKLVGEILQPAQAVKVASQAAATEEVLRPRENSMLDTNNQRTGPRRMISAANMAAMNWASGESFAGLAAPVQRTMSSSVVAGSAHFNAPYAANAVTATETPNSLTPTEANQSEILDNYGKLPLSFEQNVGQVDDRVDFVSRSGGATVFLTPTAAVFAMSAMSGAETLATDPGRPSIAPVAHASGSEKSVALYMEIVGANPAAQPSAADKLPGITNYFIGNDPNEWQTDIASFGRVDYDDVYPGIDLAYYGKNQQLEYDFIVSPGADPNAIALNFAGADGLEINPQGDLIVHTAAGDVVPAEAVHVSGGRQFAPRSGERLRRRR